LSQIKGIGEKIADKLLRAFKSVKRIKEATSEEMEEVIGKSKAALVTEHFKTKDN